MPVFIPKVILNFTFPNKPTDLHIGITKPRGNAYRKQVVENRNSQDVTYLARDTIFGPTAVLTKTVAPARVLQFKQLAEVLLTGLTSQKNLKNQKITYVSRSYVLVRT